MDCFSAERRLFVGPRCPASGLLDSEECFGAMHHKFPSLGRLKKFEILKDCVSGTPRALSAANDYRAVHEWL